MSTTPEALASTPDAPVVPAPALPDGPELETGNAAAPSPAAKVNDSDSTEPEAKWVQKRIDELTKLRHEADRREREAARDRDHWRELATRQAKPEPAKTEPERDKTLADFNFDEAAHQRYLLDRVSKTATDAAKRELQAEQGRAEKQRAAETYVERVRSFAKDHPDYKEVAEYAPIADHVAEVILGLEEGPEVAYYLGKNPEMATQINRLSANHASFELGQIAARLGFEREKAAAAKARVSTAPPPAPKIEGGSEAEVEKNPGNMTPKQFAAWRRRYMK